MKKFMSILLVAAMSVSLLAGCGGSSDSGSAQAGTTAAANAGSTSTESGDSQAAEKGEDSYMTVALHSYLTTLDPALNTETVNSYVLTHIYSGLFRKDVNGFAQPEMCETYEVSDDGLTYTFHLRDGIVWSDGTPITAQDFEYSYLRVLSYGADNAWGVNDFVNFIKGAREYNERALLAGESFDCTTGDHSEVGIEAVDDKTFVITLLTPCPYLPGLMTGNGWLPVPQGTPQHDSLWAFSAGYPTNGPYILTDVNETEKAELVKNENYYKADEITMDAITMHLMPEQEAKALAFQSGEIDVATDVSMDTASTYVGTDNLWVMNIYCNYFIAINSGSTGPKWAHDVNLRRALALAIDKDALSDILGGADFYPPLNGYVPHGLTGVSGDFREEGDADGYTLTYNPDEAKRLLAEAGHDESNPLSITYKYSNNSIHGDVATALQQMWKAVGIDVTFAAVESGVFYDQLDQGDFEIARYGYSAADSPIQFIDMWTSGMQVVAAVDDPVYDQMSEDAKKIVDPVEYAKKLHETEDYLVEENVYIIPLFDYPTPSLIQNVSGQEMNGTQPFFGHCVRN